MYYNLRYKKDPNFADCPYFYIEDGQVSIEAFLVK